MFYGEDHEISVGGEWSNPWDITAGGQWCISTSSDIFVSFMVSSVVTQYEYKVQEEENTEDVIKNPEPKGQIQDSIAAHKPKRNIQKLTWFSNIMVTYALSVKVVGDSVLSSFRETEWALNLSFGRMLWWRRLNLFMKMTLENLSSCPKKRRSLDANGFLRRMMDF